MKMPSIMAVFWAASCASGERLQDDVTCDMTKLDDDDIGEACYKEKKAQSQTNHDWTIMENFVKETMDKNGYELVPHDAGSTYKVGVKDESDPRQVPLEELALRAFVKFFDGECTESTFVSLKASLEQATLKSTQCGGGWLRKTDGTDGRSMLLQTAEKNMVLDADVKKTTAAAMRKVGRTTWGNQDYHTEFNAEEIQDLFERVAVDSGRYANYEVPATDAKTAFLADQGNKENTWVKFKEEATAKGVPETDIFFTEGIQEQALSDEGYELAARSLNDMDMFNFIHREIDASDYQVVNYKGLSALVRWYRNDTVGGCGEQSLNDLKEELKRCAPEADPTEPTFQCGGWLVKKS